MQYSANETFDVLLNGRVKIIQSRDGYRVNEDSLRLCEFVEPMPEAAGIDLGAGGGILSIVLVLEGKVRKMTALELQGPLADLARRNAVLNGLGGHRAGAGSADRGLTGRGEKNKGESGQSRSSEQVGFEGGIEVIQGDIRRIREMFAPRSFDLAVSNPPYRALGRGRPSPSSEKTIARQEQLCSLDDVIRAAAYLLKPKGIFAFCHLKERWEEIGGMLRRYGLPDSRRQKKGEIILVEARKP